MTADHDSQVDLLLAEYYRRVDAGENVDRQAFLQAHPDYADELAELFDTSDVVDEMAGPFVQAGAGNDQETVVFNGMTGNGDGLSFDTQLLPDIRDTNDLAQRRFGGYELISVLGRGGMGVVYRARQLDLDRIVAVKMITSGHLASENDVQRFFTEAQAAARLEHPNIVTVYQFGEQDGFHYYSMDLIEGTDLAQLTREGPLESKTAARYLKIVGEAVQFAHDHGILHRDLKPANVLIDERDRPLVTDFGLAKHINRESQLTDTGAAIGTPAYMSPEQASARHDLIGRASDVYSLGAVLFVLLTGRTPFCGETIVDTISDVLHKAPPMPRALNPAVHRDLESICLKCLSKDPADRYPSAQALSDDLERFLDGEPVEAKPVGPLTQLWNWSRNVPVIAAITGRHAVRPTMGQRRANLGIILTPLLLLAGLLVWQAVPEVMPPQVRIASAAQGGVYYRFSNEVAERLRGDIKQKVSVLETEGSVDNVRLLVERQAEVALVQADIVSADQISVVAPLYYDVVHVIVRRGRGITRVEDLVGHAVALGAPGSGMQESARRLLSFYDISPAQLTQTANHFTRLLEDESLAATIVTTGESSEDLHRVLRFRDFELLELDRGRIRDLALHDPSFLPVTIPAHTFPHQDRDIETVGTVSFLAVRNDARNILVRTVLQSLYKDDQLVKSYGLFSRSDAAKWRGFAFHPEAHRFFSAAVPTPNR